MERENDVQLIRRILSGNDEAFSVLVQKHQKSIHAPLRGGRSATFTSLKRLPKTLSFRYTSTSRS